MQSSGVQWTDVVTAIVAVTTAPLGVYALFQTRRALGSQSAASDMQTVLTLWDQLDEHWVRFRKAQSDTEKNFEFGQLTSYYEMACGLFKDGILSTKAARTLEEHLDEILPRMKAYPDFKRRFESLKTSDKTFANIDWFCGVRKGAKRNRLARAWSLLKDRLQRSKRAQDFDPSKQEADTATAA